MSSLTFRTVCRALTCGIIKRRSILNTGKSLFPFIWNIFKLNKTVYSYQVCLWFFLIYILWAAPFKVLKFIFWVLFNWGKNLLKSSELSIKSQEHSLTDFSLQALYNAGYWIVTSWLEKPMKPCPNIYRLECTDIMNLSPVLNLCDFPSSRYADPITWPINKKEKTQWGFLKRKHLTAILNLQTG